MQGYLLSGLHEMSQCSDERPRGAGQSFLGIRPGQRIPCYVAHQCDSGGRHVPV